LSHLYADDTQAWGGQGIGSKQCWGKNIRKWEKGVRMYRICGQVKAHTKMTAVSS